MSAWKYVVPSNENAKQTVDGVDWCFCKHCKRHAMVKKGFGTKYSSANHLFRSTTGDSGTGVEANEEEENPAASLTAVDENANNDADILAWESFTSQLEDPYDSTVVPVVAEETEIVEQR